MYNYFIFISYSRKDSKLAAYLQRQLENFRIPVKLAVHKENMPEGQDFLRPVFRDRRDLKNTEQSFTNDIQIALRFVAGQGCTFSHSSSILYDLFVWSLSEWI